MPETLCGGRLAVDQVQRLIRIDGHPIGITEMEYRVLELLAFARNNVVTRAMLLKHLYRRADDQPQPKIIDVFISKLRKKLRNASRRRGVHRDDPAARLDPARHRREQRGLSLTVQEIHSFVSRPRLRAGAMLHPCFPVPHVRRPRPRALCGGACRGWRAFAMRCGWSIRSAAGPASDLDDDEQIAAAGRQRERSKAALFDRRSAQLVGAPRPGSRRCWPSAQHGREPHAAASQTLVDEIRRELADVAGIDPAARPGPVPSGVAGSAPHSLQLPS